MANIPDYLPMVVGHILFFLGIGCFDFLARKDRRKQAVPPDSKSRLESFFLWETAALPSLILLVYVSWLTDYATFGFIGLLLPLVGLILAIVRPLTCRRTTFWEVIRKLGFVIAIHIFLIGSFIISHSGKEVFYQGDNPADIPKSVQWLAKTYIPKGATDIKLEGRSTHCEWSCKVSKEDFQKFKDTFSHEFETVEETRNYNDEGPFPYFLYEYRQNNGGGITLTYHPSTQKMTGWYSHH